MTIGPTNPELSVCATNYNCAHALEAHLESMFRHLEGADFEYLLVDNHSSDGSPEILRRWAEGHPNFRWKSRRCSMGKGRELAFRESRGRFLLVVDTDTVYFPILRNFVDRAISEYPEYAVQAIYAGVFPRALWRAVGGRRNLNAGEDFDMWIRVHAAGRMRWYPARIGENLKEVWARDSDDHLSRRYSKARRFQRLLRREFDLLQLAKYERLDFRNMWQQNAVDFGFAPLETTWFGDRSEGSLYDRTRSLVRSSIQILRS